MTKFRIYGSAIVLLMAPSSLQSQALRSEAESLAVREAQKRCGPLVVDSSSTNALWRLPPGAVVSGTFHGLQPPIQLSSRPFQAPHRRNGAGGRIIVGGIVDTTGRLEQTSVHVTLAPDSGFVKAAERYFLDARYKPAMLYGRPVRVCIVQALDV